MRMNMPFKTIRTMVATTMVSISLIMSGCSENNSAPDTKYIKDFHQSYFSKTVNPIKGDDLSLYVDYPKGVSFSDFICTFAMPCYDFRLFSNCNTKISEKSDMAKS